MYVGTHGSCVHSDNHVYSFTICLERTHEPYVPTCQYGLEKMVSTCILRSENMKTGPIVSYFTKRVQDFVNTVCLFLPIFVHRI
ncbi:hypothetical protein HMPREF9944_00765 [Segatella maculosa OT 289]|uniref:Uncharacterized protein n=1 Tax=Segatella maculosa OT 289 TaxID=999422 RepID=H1HKS1_9BACT|nr:hypothetical protein HMPREF9944_00765 [Segatella maculosa OT 289]